MASVASTSSLAVPFLDLAPVNSAVKDEVLAAASALIDRNEFGSGAAVQAFEDEFAAYCESAHAVGLASGLDALRLALLALGIGRGDEVIVPANTFVATFEADQVYQQSDAEGFIRLNALRLRLQRLCKAKRS